MDRPPLPALTGIRFFAALHVVFFHYAPGLPLLLRNVAANGYMAVGLFFILSGFVLAYNYAGRPLRRPRFFVARFARIYPAYALGLVLIAPAVVVRSGHVEPGRLAAAGFAAMGLVQAWFPKIALVWNGPGWSLANEAFFYLLFPFILPPILRLSARGVWMVATACWAAALAPPLAQMLLHGNAEAVMYMPVFRLAEFILGVAAGGAFLRGNFSFRRAMAPVSLALAAFAALSPFLIPPLLRGALAAPLFAILVCSLASGGGMLGRLLSTRPLQTMGDASYSIYILQSPVMAWFLVAARGVHAGAQRTPLTWPEFAVYTGILVAGSLACNVWFEAPARRWIQAAAAPRERCKIEIDSYDPPDTAAVACRSLRGLRPEI